MLPLIWCPFHPCVTVKDPGHSARSAGGRCYLNMHTLLTQWVRAGWLCRCPGIVWEPIQKQAHMQLVREHSATVTSALWAIVDWSWCKEWISLHELISTLKKKKCWWGISGQTFSQNSRKQGKSHHMCKLNVKMGSVTQCVVSCNYMSCRFVTSRSWVPSAMDFMCCSDTCLFVLEVLFSRSHWCVFYLSSFHSVDVCCSDTFCFALQVVSSR